MWELKKSGRYQDISAHIRISVKALDDWRFNRSTSLDWLPTTPKELSINTTNNNNNNFRIYPILLKKLRSNRGVVSCHFPIVPHAGIDLLGRYYHEVNFFANWPVSDSKHEYHIQKAKNSATHPQFCTEEWSITNRNVQMLIYNADYSF